MTKTKLNYLWLLLLLPIVLMFSACGSELDNKATCDTSGTYKAATQQDFETVLGEQTAFDADGYKFTMEAKGSFLGVTMNMDVTAIVLKDSFAMKGTADMMGVKAEYKMYYSKGTIYVEGKATGDGVNESIKGKATNKSFEDALNKFQLEQFSAYTDFEELLDMIADADVVVKKNGNHFNLKLSGIVPGDVSNLEMWINFDSNKKLEATKVAVEMSGFKTTVTTNPYKGKIDMPNPNDFKDDLPEDFFEDME